MYGTYVSVLVCMMHCCRRGRTQLLITYDVVKLSRIGYKHEISSYFKPFALLEMQAPLISVGRQDMPIVMCRFRGGNAVAVM